MKIIYTTDGKYIGQDFDIEHPMLGNTPFHPDKIIRIDAWTWRLSNTNYVIDVKEQ
jgi:hypothetical protein